MRVRRDEIAAHALGAALVVIVAVALVASSPVLLEGSLWLAMGVWILGLAALRGLALHWPSWRSHVLSWRLARQVRALSREARRAGMDERADELEAALGSGDHALGAGRLSALDASLVPHRRRSASARRIIISALLGALLAFVVRERIAAFYRIPSASMVPTLLVGDLVLTDRLSFRGGLPRPGDVVVFERVGAEGERQSFAKRVVAIEGQTVSFRGRALVVDGVPVARSLLGEAQFDASGDPVGHASFFFESEAWSESIGSREWRILQRRTAPVPSPGPWSVPSGHVFVLGDNRDDSIDSRDPSFGVVPVEAIVGRVRWVAFSRRNAGGWRLERTGIPVP